MLFFDAHFHACQCPELENGGFQPPVRPGEGPTGGQQDRFFGASCAHDRDEFGRQQELVARSDGHILPLFGMHPQLPLLENADFMEGLLKRKEICGIGETGFDRYTDEYRARMDEQEAAWRISLELAAHYQVPIVVHDRKALEPVFRDTGLLKAIPAVIFHSFAFGPREAISILRHGIHAYFSFSKQLLNGNRKSRACVAELPPDRLLLETDAPYQTLRGEERTSPFEIWRVYREAARIREMTLTKLAAALQDNFTAAYGKAFPDRSQEQEAPGP